MGIGNYPDIKYNLLTIAIIFLCFTFGVAIEIDKRFINLYIGETKNFDFVLNITLFYISIGIIFKRIK